MFIDTIYQVAQGDRDAQISKEVAAAHNATISATTTRANCI